MNRRILIRPRASQDLDELFDYIARNNPSAALRFFDATRQTIARLATMPSIGSPYRLNNERLEGLRKWKVKDFERYLIFYLFTAEILEVVRILPAVRDLPNCLEGEE